MTTALIADDEPHLAAHLARLLESLWPGLTILPIARNGVEAARRIADERPDIAFLDIRMPVLSGLEVARGIDGTTRVVFVTAFDEFAVQAFDEEAVDYVLKPVNAQRLGRTLERLRRVLDASPVRPARDEPGLDAVLRRLLAGPAPTTTPLRYVRAGHGDVTHQIDVADVLFFQADEKYTCVRTVSGAEHLIRTPIADLAAQLDPDAFWQIHRATLIHLRYLAGTRRDGASRLFVRLHGHPAELPVSRAYVHRFKPM